MAAFPSHAPDRYDPWRDLAENWPGIEVVVERMRGDLLGELRYPVIALRAGTSAAQRRCTLAHEIVHLERGAAECGQWSSREERCVHREVARRLIPIAELTAAVRSLGGASNLAQLAHALDVDCETAALRLQMLDPADRAQVAAVTSNDPWHVA